MPISVNVGLSRKASRDYQSAGVSINVTAELDQSLLARPQELQAQVADLYAQAEAAMQRQAEAMAEADQTQRRPQHDQHTAGSNGNGRRNGNPGGRQSSGATDSQRRAITAIARRAGVDPALEARDIIGAELDDLTLRQASELIDHLKSLQPASGRNGR